MGLGVALSPLGERRFRLLWLGRVASAAGDAVVPVALAFAVLSVNGSATALGAVLAAFTISRVSFALAGGVIADRFPRRRIMLGCDAVRAVVEALTAAMLFTHAMTLPLFLATGAIFGAASAFFGPAADGLVPQTISAANLQQANALLGISRNVLNVFGPALSGALIAAAGTGWVFAIDSASFVLSAFFLVQLRVQPHERPPASRFLHELRTGYAEVVSRTWVRAPIVGFAISNFCFASFLVLGPVTFQRQFHGARDWGIVSTCGAVGAIVGSIASVRLAPRRPLYGGFAASSLIALPIASLAGPLPLAAIAVCTGFGTASIALSNTWWETSLQRLIPQSVYSRVRSYDLLVSFVFMPIGMLTFGPVANAVGLEPTLLVAAGVAAATNLAVAFEPGVRAVRDASPVPAVSFD